LASEARPRILPPLPILRRERHTAGRLRTAGRICFQGQLAEGAVVDVELALKGTE
jgi:hypothetical protein